MRKSKIIFFNLLGIIVLIICTTQFMQSQKNCQSRKRYKTILLAINFWPERFLKDIKVL